MTTSIGTEPLDTEFIVTRTIRRTTCPCFQVGHVTDDDTDAAHDDAHRSNKLAKKKLSHENILRDDLLCVTNGNGEATSRPSSSIAYPVVYRSACPCDLHYTRVLLENAYDLTVDRLFELMFGNNEFVETFRRNQRFCGMQLERLPGFLCASHLFRG